jgi:hypothetical protein
MKNRADENGKQDHVLYQNFNGVVLEEEEGIRIAQTLGNKKVHPLL